MLKCRYIDYGYLLNYVASMPTKFEVETEESVVCGNSVVILLSHEQDCLSDLRVDQSLVLLIRACQVQVKVAGSGSNLIFLRNKIVVNLYSRV